MTHQRNQLADLRRALDERLSDGELRTLCFDLSIDYDNLPGTTKADKIRELIIYLSRRGNLSLLSTVGKNLRSDIFWEDLVKDTGAQLSTLNKLPRQPESLNILFDNSHGQRNWQQTGYPPRETATTFAGLAELLASFCWETPTGSKMYITVLL